MSRVEGDRSKIRRPTLFESFVGSTDEHDGFPAYMHSLAGRTPARRMLFAPPRLVHNCSVARIK
jgi:hypothetical protein